MLSFIRKQPLPHQLSMGALIAVAFFMTLLIYFISRFFSSEVNNVANDNQIKQVQLVSHNLETRFEAMVENNQTMADMFSAELTGLIRGDWSNLMDVLDSEPGTNLSKKVLFKENALLESFTKKSKHLLSIYLKKGNRFINIATSIHDENGKSIVGSKIELGHRAYPRLLNGQNYQAQSQKFGLNLYQNLAPIMINGEVIAVLETSTNLNHIMDKLSDHVKTLSFGHSGYVYVLATGKDEGKLVIHKTLTGRNVYDIQPELTKTFKQAFSLKEGSLTYSMPVEGVDTVARKSKVLFHEVKGWNWVVLLKTYEDEYQAEIDTHILSIELMCLAGTIFLMLVLWLLIRRSLYPLQEITKGLKLLGEGNLTYRFIYQKDEGNKNEMHLLKRDIAAMRDGLLNVIMQVTDSSKDLVGSAESISNVSHELQHHAKKSEAESTLVATAIDQVVVSIAEVANSTRAISIETTAASNISISGNDAVTEVEETVENLSHAFNTASNRIKDVEESSNSIGEVVDVINAIAEQTNLLALNAAIEAARAGEQGRGFAVVADEVRNLAQKTQDSTQKIQSVVEKLQANSQSAVEGMEDGAKEVALSMKKAKTAGILLTQIRESILLVEKSMLDVSCATEEQKLAAQKISNSAKSLTQTSTDTLNHSKFTSDQGQNVKDLSLALLHNISVFKVTE